MTECICETIGANPSVVRLCEEHHVYKRGDKRLTSVHGVLKVWPVKSSWEDKGPWVDARVANARDRGREVDALLSAWLSGALEEIPAGTREDVKELFMQIVPWWQHRFAGVEAKAQVILADEDIAGTADIVILSGDEIWDLKCVSELQQKYQLQLGAYCTLYEAQYGRTPKRCGVIHVKKDREPKLVPYDPFIVASEFRIVREMWKLVKRKSRE